MLASEIHVYPPYFKYYIGIVPDQYMLIEQLKHRKETALKFYNSIPNDKWNFKYAEGKWSIKKVLQHILDAELIFLFRALCIVRNDQNKLPGWDENAYADATDDSKLSVTSLLKSLEIQIDYTNDLFSAFDRDDLKKTGNANNHNFEVGAFGFAILGHEIHHRRVIEERYLNDL